MSDRERKGRREGGREGEREGGRERERGNKKERGREETRERERERGNKRGRGRGRERKRAREGEEEKEEGTRLRILPPLFKLTAQQTISEAVWRTKKPNCACKCVINSTDKAHQLLHLVPP